MKTTLVPQKTGNRNGDYRLFSDSHLPLVLIRLILLVSVTLLIVEVTQAQPAITISGNGNKAARATDKIKYNVPATPGMNVATVISSKADSGADNSGTKVRNLNNLPGSLNKANTMVNTYFQGVYDADSNYKAKKTGQGLIIAATLIGGPVVGLIPAAICSSTPPKDNLNIPNSPLVNDPAYMKGYKSEAHYIKRHNTWPCYILAGIVWLAAANILLH